MLQQTIKHTIQFYEPSGVYFCVCKNKIYVTELLTSTKIFCISIDLLSACQSTPKAMSAFKV